MGCGVGATVGVGVGCSVGAAVGACVGCAVAVGAVCVVNAGALCSAAMQEAKLIVNSITSSRIAILLMVLTFPRIIESAQIFSSQRMCVRSK